MAAVAGAGKTSSILELMAITPPHVDGMYVAFNKHIVEEIKEKNPPSNFAIGTLHSRGYASIASNHRGKFQLEDWKTFKLIQKIAHGWKDVKRNKLNAKIHNISEYYNYYRLTNQTDFSNFAETITKYDLNVDRTDLPKITECFKLLNEYNQKHNTHNEFLIDFIDMIYLPVYLRFPIKQVSVLMIDEAQDLSALQHVFIEKMLKPGGRMVIVGDEFQGVYGFAGSDIESWNKYKKMDNLVELPLSYCYRCGKNIVNKSNQVHDIMESPDWMHDGEVVEDGNLLYLKSGDFVLCRNTKPLVELYFNLLTLEKPCYIKGSDVGRGLIKALEEYKNLSSTDTITAMTKELNNIYRFLISHGVQQPQKHQKYLSYSEKLEIIQLFAWKYKTTKEIMETIARIFADKGEGIMLSTVHKCKGLETDDVYLYLPHLIPSKYATQPWQLDQEANLLYVALTRAKQKLTFVKEVFSI